MSRPAVSIITPAYNSARYLADTIRSAQAQTVGDFEMLIVDDGSTDATAEIARQFAAADSRLRLFRQENRGISSARNAAIARAEAPIFALLDSDDIWMPTYLEEQLRVLAAAPEAGVVSANAFNLGGSFDGMLLRSVGPEVHRVSLRSLIEVEDSVCIMSIFRRDVVDRIGVFDTTLPSSEDYDFWLRAAVAGFDVLFNGTPLGFYRRRAESVSADDDRMLASIATVLRKTRQSLPAGSPETAAVDRQLDRFTWTRVANSAKLALYRGQFEAAAEGFAKLAAHGSSLRLRLTAVAARHAPNLLLLAHRAMTAVRSRHRPVADARFARPG
jgi:glycosyltransferase involved in cell wall biosynthesis